MQSAKTAFSRVSVLLGATGHPATAAGPLALSLAALAAVHFDKSEACLSMVGVYVLCLPQHLFGISLARQLILRIEARHGFGGKRV